MTDLPELTGQRALITGITGQDGSYLAEHLIGRGYEVWGIVRRCSTDNKSRLSEVLGNPAKASRLHLVDGDMCDSSSLRNAVAASRPSEVYNLAAQSHVKVSFEVPEYTADVCGLGVVRLLEAIRECQPDARFYQASSSELYGKVVETPQTEETPFHPRSPYAAAKAFAYNITRNYREAYGMFSVNGILFNHESPRRGENFVTRKITLAVGNILAGKQKELRLGNLDAQRDWGFAGDYVEAMWLMLQQDQPEDYVIATGKTFSVRQFCERAFAYAGMPITWSGEGTDEVGIGPSGDVLIRIDPKFFRPAEVDLLIGDATKAKEQLGWTPRVSFEALAEMMVEADRCAE
ncbi:GDP-mannose 4,6-dehydratase [Thalassoglobus sp. JC818]|uniref:GDP-mannose 4,6-dehydratase n=1 Tax=Thalassoglobus sp. JC818 TaxID=3232136 RepID=UPI00345AC02A